MIHLDALTCQQCGGGLTRSHTPKSLVCPYCGAEYHASDLPDLEDARPQLQGAISIGLPDGGAVVLIERGTRLPAEISHSFSTARDNQVRLEIPLLFGDSRLARDNVPLGPFILDDLKPAPRGTPDIEVRMKIDECNHLTVTVTEDSAKRTEVLGQVDLLELISLPSRGQSSSS